MANQQESAQQDEHSGKGISIWLEDLRRAHEYLDAGKPFFTGKDCAELADLLESLARSTKAAQQDEREAESVIGVGDGSGNLFVRGPHEAIMRVRSFIFDAEKWRAQQVQADAGAVSDKQITAAWLNNGGSLNGNNYQSFARAVLSLAVHPSPAAESDKP